MINPDFQTAKNDYRVEPLGVQHWEAYKDFYLRPYRRESFVGLLKEKDLDDPETWKNLITEMEKDYVMFGLWDGNKIIGQSAIALDKKEKGTTASITGIEIDPAYQGRHLFHRLANTMLQYLKDINFQDELRAHILPTNKTALALAKRAGWVFTGEMYSPTNEEDVAYCIMKPAALS